MPIRILLTNVHSYKNAGDAALTEVAIEQLRRYIPGSIITLMMNDPGSFNGDSPTVISFLGWIIQNSRKQALRLIWLAVVSLVATLSYRILRAPIMLPISIEVKTSLLAYIQSDLIICTAGGYFYRYGRGRALMILMFTIALAILAKKPLYFLPQSFGPLDTSTDRFLANRLLRRARIIFAREKISLDNLIMWGIPRSILHLSPDLAFLFQGDTPEEANTWLVDHGIDPQADRPLLGVTLLDWGAQYQNFTQQNAYEQAIISALEHFVRNYGGKILFVIQSRGPTQFEDDRIPVRRVAAKLTHLKDAIFIIEEPLPPRLLFSVYGKLDICIGTRMHANIFALKQYVPIVPIEYLHKTRGIARELGIEEWVIDINNITGERLIQKLDSLWLAKDNFKKQLQKIMPQITKESEQACQLIAIDYASGGRAHTR